MQTVIKFSVKTAESTTVGKDEKVLCVYFWTHV